MAYLCFLASVPLDKTASIRLPEDISKVASRIARASHFIVSVNPEIREAMDGGKPLDTDTWHPLRGFMVHEPTDVQQRAAELGVLGAAMRGGEHPLYGDDWSRSEVTRVIDLFQHAKSSGEAVVTFLDLTRTGKKKI